MTTHNYKVDLRIGTVGCENSLKKI